MSLSCPSFATLISAKLVRSLTHLKSGASSRFYENGVPWAPWMIMLKVIVSRLPSPLMTGEGYYQSVFGIWRTSLKETYNCRDAVTYPRYNSREGGCIGDVFRKPATISIKFMLGIGPAIPRSILYPERANHLQSPQIQHYQINSVSVIHIMSNLLLFKWCPKSLKGRNSNQHPKHFLQKQDFYSP